MQWGAGAESLVWEQEGALSKWGSVYKSVYLYLCTMH